MLRQANPNQTRLGAIAFVNTLPIDFRFTPGPDILRRYEAPAVLNALIRAGQLDVSPVSSLCYLREKHRLYLLPGVSVSSFGAVESVLFLTRFDLDSADFAAMPHIYVPDDSETSIGLLSLLLREKTGDDASARFTSYPAAQAADILATWDNALIIGDRALYVQEQREQGGYGDFQAIDLSLWWRRQTGLPFVFAVWAARKDWAATHPDVLADIQQRLCDSRDGSFHNPELFQALLQAARDKSGLSPATLERYYRHCLDYQFDDAHRQALTRFEAAMGLSVEEHTHVS